MRRVAAVPSPTVALSSQPNALRRGTTTATSAAVIRRTWPWYKMVAALSLLLGSVLYVRIRLHDKHNTFERSTESFRSQEGITTVDSASTNSVGASRPLQPTDDPSSLALNKLLYTGYFGMGHRLSKLSAAVHLAQSLDLPMVQVDWGTCGVGNNDGNATVDIFAHLFGSNEIVLRAPRSDHSPISGANSDYQGKVIWVRNDVAGYAAAQAYKNAARPLSYNTSFYAYAKKLGADVDLWTALWRKRLTVQSVVSDFQRRHAWNDSLVIGIHVRAGNGEQDHFVVAQRGILAVSVVVGDEANLHNASTDSGTATIVAAMAHLVTQMVGILQKQPQNRLEHASPVLIFVATDTVQYVDWLREALPSTYRVVSYEAQPRVPGGQGVSYQAWAETEHCLEGWRGAAIDMALLASSHLLVATSRSTFTQIVPAALVFHQSPPVTKASYNLPWRFCEMDLSSSATSRMTCVGSQESWLLRRETSHTHTFCATGQVSAQCPQDGSVVHKIMVHLPDVHSRRASKLYTAAQDFLQQSRPPSQNDSIFYYGRKFDPTYRDKAPFRKDWMWVDD
jgi:hypothetical protein